MGKAQSYLSQADLSKPQTRIFWLPYRIVFTLLGSLGYTALLHITIASALTQPSATNTEAGKAATEVLMRPTLKSGSRGAEVTELQATLKLLGYYSSTVDGVYGQSTVAAVSQFQQAAGLGADGITGPATWNRLFPAVETPSTPPTPTTSGSVQAPAVATAASPSIANSSAASFPVPAGSSPAPSSVKPVTNSRPAVKPAPSSVTPKPGKTTTTPSPATAATSPNAPVVLPTLRRGMRGSAVVALQERLRSLGVFKGAADGVFGAETLTAVKAAQRSFRLEQDGVVGAGTWSALLR